MLLLSRPKPNPLESLRGYILRLCQANHYQTNQLLLEMAGLWTGRNYDTASNYVYGDTCLKKLAKISGSSVNSLKSMRYGLDENKQSIILNQCISNQHLRLDYPRICTHCLKNNNLALAIWDIPAITVCPEHQTLLIDHCPACQTRIRWNRQRINVCHNCSYDFCSQHSEKLLSHECRLSRLIYQLCMVEKLNNRNIPKQLFGKSLAEILELTSSLSLLDYQLTNEYLKTNKPLSLKSSNNTLLHKHYSSAMHHLDQWPHNFHAFLAECRQIRKDRGVNGGISKEIGAPFYLLKANKNIPVYKPFWDAYCEYRDKAKRQTIQELKQLRIKADFIPVRTAARGLKIRPELLLKYCSRLKIMTKSGSGNQRLINRSQIARLQEIFERVMTMSQASHQLGVTVYQLRSLINDGIIVPFRGPTVDNSRDWLFMADELEAFQKNIHQQCSKTKSNNDDLRLKDALSHLRFYKQGLPELVSAILVGKITPSLSCSEAKLQDLRFSTDEIQALRPKTSSSSDYWQPPEIMESLCCTKHVVFGLLNTGQLPLEKIDLPGRTRPVVACRKSSVKKFREKFYMLSEIAEMLGFSPVKTKKLLSENGFLPVSGKDIDGGYCWLYQKKTLSKRALNNLSATQ